MGVLIYMISEVYVMGYMGPIMGLEKFHRGILCPHREMQQSSLCVQMFYFNMKRHKLIHGIIYT